MSDSTPICRCRVLYLGSSVPQQTKDGLQGIQEPLQVLYPEEGAVGAKGIDSWLSVWSNGILLENVDENHKKITRFFPIDSLHYCAAIRYVLVPEKNTLHNPSPRFLPLDSPFARAPNPTHPPLFAAILRRTTGIKVLECHAFICKREVAANALVRCCFHAYADSSYAKQADTAGSLYGTLASQKAPKEKVEDWKLNRSMSGSSMTINTITNGKDDVSIYNGDENHKVWAGSQDNLDGIYDVYSTSTISRTPRPRQIAAPVPVPPPPSKEKNPKKQKKKNGMSASREDLYHHPLTNGKANSVSGTLLKSKIPPNYHPGHHQQPIYVMAHPPPIQTLPNPKFAKHYGNTFSHRPRGRMLMPARPIPPPLVPVPPNHHHHLVIPSHATLTKKGSRKSSKHMTAAATEEPIYLASSVAGRTLSPPNFHHHHHQPSVLSIPPQEAAYMMHHHQQQQQQHHHQNQYATMELPGKMAKKNAAGRNGGGGGGSSNGAKLSKKLAQSMNGLDDPALVAGGDESPYSTGIYKKKGHLNERAFSYSIRQEHRSRSYGSLANLKFATPIPNGHDVEDRVEDFKKEREIMQMVHDLDLSGDEIERSEVPRGIYESRHNSTMTNGAPLVITSAQINGRSHKK